jgi:hypothetical protein
MGACTHNTVVAPFLAFRASCSNASTCGTRVERLSRITASVKRWVPFARFLRYVRQCCGNNIGPEKLLKVIKNPISDHLPPGARRIGATPLSELVTLSCVHVRLHDRVQPHGTFATLTCSNYAMLSRQSGPVDARVPIATEFHPLQS